MQHMTPSWEDAEKQAAAHEFPPPDARLRQALVP